MKKEGTGDPRAPDISLDANVKVRELRFEEVPDPEVRFRGDTRRNSVWGSRRENLPNRVQEDVEYRDARVRLRIATEIAEGDPDSWSGPGKESEEREQTDLEHRQAQTGRQGTETEEGNNQ